MLLIKNNPLHTACVLLILIITCGCLWHSPFHVLSHEFSFALQITTIFMALLLGFYATRRIHQQYDSPAQRLSALSTSIRQDAIFLLALTALSYLIVAFSSYYIQHCHVFEGSISFWVSVIPSFLFALVWAYSVGIFYSRWQRFIGLTVMLFVALSLYDACNSYFGYQSVYMYLLLGNLPYQKSVSLPNNFHIYSRLMLLGLSLLCYHWSVFLYRKKHKLTNKPRSPFITMTACTSLFIIIVWCSQTYTGLGWSFDRIQQYLNQTRDVAYLRIHYSSNNPINDQLWRKITWDAHKIAERMELSPQRKVDVYVFPAGYSSTVKSYTNGRASAFASIGKVFLSEGQLLSDIFPHELVHALHALYQPHPAILLRRTLLEGTAKAFEGGLTLAPQYHQAMAALEQQSMLPSIEDFYQDLLFIHHSEGLSYQAAGSFVGFLVLEYGLDTYKVFNKTLDFEASYGYSLSTLNQQWKGFLQNVPVDIVQRTKVVANYKEDKSYIQHYCPQVGTQATDEDAARVLPWWIEPDRAQTVFEQWLEKQPENSDWAIKQILALMENKQLHLAEEKINRLLQNTESNDIVTLEPLYQLKFFIHVLNDDKPGAITALQTWLKESGEQDSMRNLRLAVLQHPTIGSVYFSNILTTSWLDRSTVLRSLYQLDPQFGPAYFYALKLQSIHSGAMKKFQLIKDFTQKTSGFKQLKIEVNQDFLVECINTQTYDVGLLVVAHLQQLTASQKDKVVLQQLTARLAYEKQHFTEKQSTLPLHQFSRTYLRLEYNRVW